MGIPSFFSYILKNNKQVFTNVKSIDALMMDCNSIIYDIVKNNKELTNHTEIYQLVCEKIDAYIELLEPSTLVYISFDGVVPLAKMEQQRQRRFRSSIEKELLCKTSSGFNTIQITPGTKFMNGLDVFVENYFKNNKMIIFSGSTEKGEGEHKIFNYLKEGTLRSKNVCVYGLDADLIILSLSNIDYCKNVYLCRELPEELMKYKHLSWNQMDENSVQLFMDMGIYKNIIHSYMCNHKNVNYNSMKIKDFIFLSFLLGNDFMPHFPFLNIRTNGISVLLEAYNKVFTTTETIMKSNEIQWRQVKKLFTELQKGMYDEFKKEYFYHERSKKRNVPKTKEDKLLYLPYTFDDEMYHIDIKTKGWEKRYYEVLFNNMEDFQNVKKITKNYIEALEWTYDYYQGRKVSWEWKYNYLYAPLYSDIIRMLPDFKVKMIRESTFIPHPQTLLSYVMPKEGLSYLNKDVFHYMMKNKSTIYNLDCAQLKMAFCKFFWESHLQLEPVNIIALQNEINNILH